MKKYMLVLTVCAVLTAALFVGCMGGGAESSSEADASSAAEISETESSGTETADGDPALPQDENAGVSVDFAAEELLAQPDAYWEFIADESEYQVKAELSTTATVTDLRVLSLNLEDAGDDGAITFSAEELYRLEELTPEKPLVIGMAFAGDIPNMGVSFVDKDGGQHAYAIAMSGKDGSLLLSEIELA